MALPAWLKSHVSADTDQPHDTWNGKTLPQRNPIYQDIHYRIYDQRNNQLLSFGTTNVLDAVAAVILRTRDEHPNAVLHVVQLNGPAYQ